MVAASRSRRIGVTQRGGDADCAAGGSSELVGPPRGALVPGARCLGAGGGGLRENGLVGVGLVSLVLIELGLPVLAPLVGAPACGKACVRVSEKGRHKPGERSSGIGMWMRGKEGRAARSSKHEVEREGGPGSGRGRAWACKPCCGSVRVRGPHAMMPSSSSSSSPEPSTGLSLAPSKVSSMKSSSEVLRGRGPSCKELDGAPER